MFTGIIKAKGRIAAIEKRGGDVRLRVTADGLPWTDYAVGDSIAVNGVCLTAVELPGDGFWADVSGETLAHTSFAELRVGSRVNLEKALMPTSRLGGHLVSGHVDGVGEVLSRSNDGRSVRFRIQAPAALAKYIAAKGSITIDGVSLTVNAVEGAEFELNIVPHTLQETTLAGFAPGRKVNLEVDVIARYLERLLLGERAAQPSGGGMTMEFLAQHGFLK